MTGLAKRAAIYARSATVREREPQLALATQIHDCVEYAANQGYLILEELVYQETCSGLSLNRPALTALREAAKRGEFDVLLVFTYDRISRNQSDTVKILFELEACHVRIECVREPSEERAGRQFLRLPHSFLEQAQEDMLAARTRRGSEVKKRTTGPAYGYKWRPDGSGYDINK